MTTCLAQPFPAHVQRFPNGLKLIHQELSATGVVAVDVWVGAGARLESDAELGVAHFLEHMVFKGTEATAPGVFDQLIEAHGGITNAATSLDYAHYSVVTAASHWQQPLITLADLLLGAAIPEEEFWRERQVVFEELRQTQDDPDWLAHQTLLEVAYGAHPYCRPILGTPESLTQLHPETLRRFHRHYYQPANMTVVVVGAVGLDA
ncbi:MAG: insulinase family protein, partial [Gloeomargaritaceae cyanobacterium C42_A2020_066]|nr:insulinase family protein [Gloeomargaritaceae cyanobacterium C42_A2020_066]